MASEIRELFVRRLREEMLERQLSTHDIARLAKLKGRKIGKSSVHRIWSGAQDPTLDKIFAITEALGVPPWFLLTDRERVEERIIRPPIPRQENSTRGKVHKFPELYPPIFGRRSTDLSAKPKRSRKA